MFYSHEVLTSRKYGVATVWLVATLGQRSSARKVSRKQILDVDVAKACETIITPEAPMALRLQSNLLYGVSRVYDQQCGYVLADAQAAQNTMRTLLKVVRAVNLDSADGRTRPDNLLLEDDPAFLPDAALMPLLDDILRRSLPPGFEESQLINSLSFRGTPGADGNLILPSSQSASLGGFMLPGADSVSGAPRPSSLFAREDEPLLDLDLDIGLNFDADGELQEGPALRDVHQTPMRGLMPSDGNTSARVREEHAVGHLGAGLPGDHVMDEWQHIDDGYDLPPAAAAGTGDLSLDHDRRRSSTVLESSDTAASAPQRRRRVPKVIKADSKSELRSRELLAMNNDYLVNMTNDLVRSHAIRTSQQAKKNADYWVLGRGLGDVGSGLGHSKSKGPLADMFSGPSLYQWITGSPPDIAGQKRESDPEDTTDSERQKRPRFNDEDQVGRAEPADMGMVDDGYIFQGDDTELARDQPSALDDVHSAMPWNILSSIRGSSVNRVHSGIPGVAGSAAGSLSRRGSRMVSASPLIGRGRPPILEDPDNADPTSDAGPLHYMGALDVLANEEFERFGPGADVDTQTAAQSSWQNAALDRESNNFYDFIENAVQEKREADGILGEAGEEVAFEELLRPEVNSVVVAAQGLLHVLTLVTKNLIRVEQDIHYGDIRMSLMGGL